MYSKRHAYAMTNLHRRLFTPEQQSIIKSDRTFKATKTFGKLGKIKNNKKKKDKTFNNTKNPNNSYFR